MRGSKQILWVALVVLLGAAGAAVYVTRTGGGPGATEARLSVSTGAPSVAVISSGVPAPASAAPVAQPEDPTKVDRVMQGPFTLEYTAGQEARLQALRKEFGELESQVALAERAINDARATSVGLPGIREHVEELKAARAALDAHLRGLPVRAGAEAAVRTAAARDGECRALLQGFYAHVESHLKKAAGQAPADCEWCRRDAARIAARDATLGRTYTEEAERLSLDAQTAAEALRKARIDLAGVIRSAPETEEGRALVARAASAQRALDGAMASLPDVVQLRAEAGEARARQKTLAAEMTSIRESARRVIPSVAKSGGTENGKGAPGP